MNHLIAYIRAWYCVAGLVVFSLLLMPVMLIYIIALPHDIRHRMQISGVVCWFFSFCTKAIWGIRFRMQNTIGEDFRSPAIVIANHQSMLDLIVIQALSPRLVTMTNQWVWRFPLFNYMLRYIGHIPADGYMDKSAAQLVEERMREGYSVVIFPEGTRTPDGRIGRFHRGAFEIAERLECDIVAVTIKGAYQLAPKGGFRAYSGEVVTEIAKRESNHRSETPRFREICHNWHEWYKEQLS